MTLGGYAIANVQAGHCPVWFFFNPHRRPHSFSSGNASYALHLLLDRPKTNVPGGYDCTCGRWRVRKALPITEIVQECVGLGKEGVLCHDLGCEKMGENGERGGNDRRKTRLKMIVCNLIFLLLN